MTDHHHKPHDLVTAVETAFAGQVAGWSTPAANEPDTNTPDRPSRLATGRTTEDLGRQVRDMDIGATLHADPALFPLAPSMPGRVGLLKGAGNAIHPHVAAEFIRAAMKALDNPANP